MPQPRMKTKKLNETTIVTITAEWEDTSFDHEFGTKVQGHYDVINVLINGVEIPLDILDAKFLEEMVNYVNE